MAILNGTFSKWAAEGRKTEDGDTEKAWKKYLPSDIKLQPSDFDFLCDNTRVRDYKEIVRISNFNLVASDTKGPLMQRHNFYLHKSRVLLAESNADVYAVKTDARTAQRTQPETARKTADLGGGHW